MALSLDPGVCFPCGSKANLTQQQRRAVQGVKALTSWMETRYPKEIGEYEREFCIFFIFNPHNFYLLLANVENVCNS